MTEERTSWLESLIDGYVDEPASITKFILPGGTSAASLSHIARTKTREIERQLVGLLDDGEAVSQDVLTYINRLSDYFFIVARVLNARSGVEDVIYHNSVDVFGRQ